MTITPSPRRQSWATWLSPITRHSRPISVQPPARVERCTVTYSRITVSAPTRTPEGVPSLYLRSWGAPPTTLPWPTFTRGPSATRPSSTAWWPISTPLSSVTSGPITLKAPTRTPASSRARGSMIAEGWIASLTALALALETAAERLHRALQRTHALQQIGQARLRGEDPLGFQDRPRGSSEVAAAGVEVGWHAALRGDQRPVAYGPVVLAAPLARQHHAAPEPGAARDADLGHEDRVLPHLDVMSDLDEIVDLGAAADDRVAEGRAVDRAVGADLDVVLDRHAAHLGNLAVARAVEGEAEAVGADDGARMHEDAAPEPRTREQRDVRAQHAALADLHAGAEVRERTDARARPDARARLDHHQRAHGRRRVDARVRGHDGARVHAGNEGRGRGEEQPQIDHRLLGRGHAQHGRRQAADARGGDEGAGPRGLGGQMVAGGGGEGHSVRPPPLQRADAPHHPRGVTLEGGAQRLRELAESELGSADHRRYFFLPPASRS